MENQYHQVGYWSTFEKAEAMCDRMLAQGYDAYWLHAGVGYVVYTDRPSVEQLVEIGGEE